MQQARRVEVRPSSFKLEGFGQDWFRWVETLKGEEGDLAQLKKGGGNGTWLLLLCLVWWADAIDELTEGSETKISEDLLLDKAIKELTDAFNGLLGRSVEANSG